MTDENENDKNNKYIIKHDLEELHQSLKALCPDGVFSKGQLEIMEHQVMQMIKQAEVMDAIMLRMLADADDREAVLIQYALALKAQNQYRQTVLAIDTVNRRTDRQREERLEEALMRNKKETNYDQCWDY